MRAHLIGLFGLGTALCLAMACVGEDPDGGAPTNDGGTNPDGSRDEDVITGVPGNDGSTSDPDAGPPPAKGDFGFFTRLPNGNSTALRNVVARPGNQGFVFTFVFKGTITVGNKTYTQMGDFTSHDIAIVKTDALGNIVDSRVIAGDAPDDPGGLAIDEAGNVYLAGVTASSSINFGNSKVLNKAGPIWAFVLKLDANLGTQWAKRISDGNSNGIFRAFRIATRGNRVAIAGSSTPNAISYDNAQGQRVSSPPRPSGAASGTCFVMALSPGDGNASWFNWFDSGSPSEDYCYDVGVDANLDVYVAGSFDGTTLRDLGTAVSANRVGAGRNAFVAKLLGADGVVQWSKAYGDTGGAAAEIFRLAADAYGRLITIGEFAGNINLGFGTRATAGQKDVFVLSLDPANGSSRWDKTFGGSVLDTPLGIAIDPWGQPVASITTEGGTSQPIDGQALPTQPGAYVIKLDALGKALWVKSATGDTTNNIVKAGGIATSANGSIAVHGAFLGTTNFGGGNVTANPAVGYDSYLLGLAP